ncbi:hypothetical protein ACVGXO_14360, partial [Enterobacter hormaechei]
HPGPLPHGEGETVTSPGGCGFGGWYLLDHTSAAFAPIVLKLPQQVVLGVLRNITGVLFLNRFKAKILCGEHVVNPVSYKQYTLPKKAV